MLSLVAMVLSLYIVITHDDYKRHKIEPIEMSDCLQKWCPVEYTCSLLLLGFSAWSGIGWTCALPLLLCCYNVHCYRKQMHKQYFITHSEYKGQQLFQYEVKSVAYALVMATAVVQSVFKVLTVLRVW